MWRLADVGTDWRRTVGDAIFDSLARTWLPEYDADARRSLGQLLSRTETAMTGFGVRTLLGCDRDAVVSLEYIEPLLIRERGDRRYGSAVMAQFLRDNPTLDLVPIIVGSVAGELNVLDGHHRLRAYALAGRPALAFRSRVTRGYAVVRLGAGG